MGRVKSDNRYLGVSSGFDTRWVHSTNTSFTIAKKTGEPFVLVRMIISNTSASAITLTDTGDTNHAARVIANPKASISEGTYTFMLPLDGSLRVDNPGGSDLTIVYSNN